MSEESNARQCTGCGAEIPTEAPHGLCPKCLLEGVTAQTEERGTGLNAPEAPSIERVGEAFPQLEVIDLIGQGGMGFVFKARQPKLDRYVALKILPERLAEDTAFRERFERVNRLSLSLTIAAALFFSGCVWALALEGKLGRGDGIVLIGLFLFWQCMQVVEVMKLNVIKSQSLPERLWLDFLILVLSGYIMVVSLEGLVNWLGEVEEGFFSADRLGWLSGWLLVLPNAAMAMWYGWKQRPDVVYSSQVGDGDICIPLCLGLFAVCQEMPMPKGFAVSMGIVVGAAVVHLACVSIGGRLPRVMGGTLIAAYIYFVCAGLIE